MHANIIFTIKKVEMLFLIDPQLEKMKKKVVATSMCDQYIILLYTFIIYRMYNQQHNEIYKLLQSVGWLKT